MQYIDISLKKRQYISDIEPFKSNGLETDSIYLKQITGCGITQFSIREFKENIIIILPNVPVIKGKEAEHNKHFPENEILGVYKGVDVDDIKEYLVSEVRFKKILTTPEGFIYKILKAFDNLDELYNSFFLLYDECERIITDVNYRGDIAAPIDEFFKFKRKAMVSATTLPFTDVRFQSFKHFRIVPSYDFSRELAVIGTDSVTSSLQNYLQSINSNHISIFFNSTNGIYDVINWLNIEKESKVFCADESVAKLFVKGFRRASSSFSPEDMVKYNFFSSRYFSAVDIKIDYKPDVIMLSDVVSASHSMLDPHTECIQIPGRFRNGINSFIHITNFNSKLDSMTMDECHSYLQGCFDTYEGFKKSYSNATNKGSRAVLKYAIDNNPAASFYTNNKINTFMVDNFIHEERVKGYYKEFNCLKAAYEQRSSHFQLTFKEEKCVVSDMSLLNLTQRQTKKEKMLIVFELFKKWRGTPGEYIFPPEQLRDTLSAQYPLVWEAHLYLTQEEFTSSGLTNKSLKRAIKRNRDIDQLRFLAKKVYINFKEYTEYPESQIRDTLTEIYHNAGIIQPVGAARIKKFFKAVRTNSKGERVYFLKNKLFVDLESDD